MINKKYTFFKITKCLQYHGKNLPALTRYMSRISFPSPSYSKKFKSFPLAGEILGLFQMWWETGRWEGVGQHEIHQCNQCNHNDCTYQHKPSYSQPTTNNQQTNAKQLPSSPNMSLLLVTPMEQSQSTATCNEMKTEIMLIICKINNNKE